MLLEGTACREQEARLDQPTGDSKSAVVALPRPLPRERTYYVSVQGKDSNPGTLERPWRTIQKAARTLRPGERALVRKGMYRENVQLRRPGTASQPITIAAYPRERPVISHASGPLEIDTGYSMRVRFRSLRAHARHGDRVGRCKAKAQVGKAGRNKGPKQKPKRR